MGHISGAGDTPNSSPLTDQTQTPEPAGSSNGHTVQQTDVPSRLRGLAPDQTSGTPVNDRDTTSVDGAKPTPGLAKPSGDKDLPALEKKREDMLKEAGDLAGKHEELYVLAHALRAVAPPGQYPDELAKAPGLKVTLQMSPGAPVYTLEPPDEAFKALPKEQREKMKAMAFNLLMEHNNTKFKGFDLPASKKRLEELKEQLEKNGNEIGTKGGDNNWRDRYTKLEQRPVRIVINSDSVGGARVTATDEKEKPKPQVKVSADDVPVDDDVPTTPVSSSEVDLNNNFPPPSTHG